MKKLLFLSLLISVPAWGMEMGKEPEYTKLESDETVEMTTRIIAKINRTKKKEYVILAKDLTRYEIEEGTETAQKVVETEENLGKICDYFEEVYLNNSCTLTTLLQIFCCHLRERIIRMPDPLKTTDELQYWYIEDKGYCLGCESAGPPIKVPFDANKIKNLIRELPWVKEVWTEKEYQLKTHTQQNNERSKKIWPDVE